VSALAYGEELSIVIFAPLSMIVRQSTGVFQLCNLPIDRVISIRA
jgi:hypothetical protein